MVRVKTTLATLNRLTVALVVVSLGLAGWLAFQRLDQAPSSPNTVAASTR